MTRLFSALLLLPLVIVIVWFLPPGATLLLAIAASLLAVIEYAALTSAIGVPIPRGFTAACAVLCCTAAGLGSIPLEVVLLGAVMLVGLQTVAVGEPGPGALWSAAAPLFAMLYIGLPLGAIAAVRVIGGREAVVLLVITMVVSDSAQYYTGRAFGRTPLAPAISPKKTREGAAGGVLFGAAAMMVGGRWVFPAAPLSVLATAAIIVVVLGIAGDLFESLLKRSAGLKDSSALIPGHGGILDRIDSWLFAGPAYYVFVRYLQA